MERYFQFIKHPDSVYEPVPGREHHWYFHPDMTKGAQTLMVRVRMPKGGMHNFHRHPEMNEILYFLKGTAEQWVEDQKQILGPGDSVYIDPDMVHATFNIGEGDLEFLAILAPGEGWEAGTIDEYENHPYASYRD